MSVTPSFGKDNTFGPNERIRMEKEIKKLKEMLSIHLDLIQHQADQAASRETQVKALRRENDLLLQKVERMERRLSVPVRSPPTLSTPMHVTQPAAPPPMLLPPPPPVVRVDVATSPRPGPTLNTAHTQTARAERHGRYTQTVVESQVSGSLPSVQVPRPPMARRSGRSRTALSPPPPPPPLQPAPSIAVQLTEHGRALAHPEPPRRLSHHSELAPVTGSPPREVLRRLSHHAEPASAASPSPERSRRLSHHLESPVSPPPERSRRLSHHIETHAEHVSEQPLSLCDLPEAASADSPSDSSVVGSHSLRPRRTAHYAESESTSESPQPPVERPRRLCHHLEPVTSQPDPPGERSRRLCHHLEPVTSQSDGDDPISHRTRAAAQDRHPSQEESLSVSPARSPAHRSQPEPTPVRSATPAQQEERCRPLEHTVSAENRRLQRRLARKGDELVKLRKCLLTEAPYHQYIPTPEEEWDSEDASATAAVAAAVTTNRSSSAQHRQIEIPRWSLRPLSPIDVAPVDVEHLDDAVFTKRHAKHEVDEKRRKRWDLQRLREQRAYEKLKQSYSRGRSGRAQTAGESSERPLTLRPAAAGALYLQVTPRLPVCVFGTNLPPLSPSDFQLPWTPGKPPPPASAGAVRSESRSRR